MRFRDRTVLVVGGAVGIGLAFASRAATEGAHVVIADRRTELEGLVLTDLGGPGRHAAVDVDATSTESVEEALSSVSRMHGGLDVLVNVVGGDTAHEDFASIADSTWFEMFDLNLMSVVRTCRAALPLLRRSTRSPAIVNVSSVNALTALGSVPYSSAKAALSAVTVNLASSLGPEGIRVNAVAPGTIRTRVWDDQPGGADRMRGMYPLGRVGEPEDVASAIAFLASDDAAWITGHTLPVDGGLLAAGPSSHSDAEGT